MWKKMYQTYGVWVPIRSKLNHVEITAHLETPTIRTKKNQIVERQDENIIFFPVIYETCSLG